MTLAYYLQLGLLNFGRLNYFLGIGEARHFKIGVQLDIKEYYAGKIECPIT